MSVVLAVEEVGPCRMQLKIEIPTPAFEAETARVTADYGRKARIPGFRKGKVPANLVRKHFGREIEQEVVERLVPRYWRQAAAEKGIEPLTAPEVSVDPFLAGAPMTFTATVDVRPEIELRNYQDFNLPAPATEPTADEVQRTLDDVRRAHAQWIPVERAAATGDRAKIQITETTAVDPSTADEVAVQEMEIEVGTPQIWEELSLAVTGLTVGQGSKFRRSESVTPEASEESALVGPDGERIGNLDKKTVERTFDVKLVELSEAKLPALDDEFARHLGKFENIAEVEADVRRRIETAKRDDALRQRETAMLDQLTDRHPFPLPEGVILQETEELLREYAESLVRRGVDLEAAGLDWQKLGEQARPQAERRVKARLLLDAVSAKEGIEVGEEEFEQALAVLARTQGMAAQALRQKLDQGGQLAGLRARMRREKTVRRLLGEPDRATVAPQAATGATAAAQAADETATDA
ncbi:MAG: trigger factor [Thermoanaerobaculia bacterium]